MGVQDSIMLFGSPNLSYNGEIRICPAAQTLFSVQPISRVLEVQMHRFIFCWKAKHWDKYRDLLNTCTHHGFETWRLVSYFYEGLNLKIDKWWN